MRAALLALIALLILVGVPGDVWAQTPAAVVRMADVRLRFGAPTTCDVDTMFTVDVSGPLAVDHRLQVFDGARAELRGVDGGAQPVSATSVGRTQSLTIQVPSGGTHTYHIRYSVMQPAQWAYRCPIWLPAIATDGRSRVATVRVELPAGGSPVGHSLPALQWSGAEGSAALSSVPAFVHVRFRMPGEGAAGLDLSTMMDAVAVASLLGGTVLWLWYQRRQT